jgi:5-methylcytosine-specific restriction endonuclease McrA
MGRKKNIYPTNVCDEVKRLYNSKRELKQIDINVFQEWYDSKNGSCQYCGLTSQESQLLFISFPESTRGGRRGKRLEIDRIDPSVSNYGHDINNLTLSCYWCNNARTNYFTSNEFRIIGKQIKSIQQERIKKLRKL